jgi:hypothetical protein
VKAIRPGDLHLAPSLNKPPRVVESRLKVQPSSVAYVLRGALRSLVKRELLQGELDDMNGE